MKNHTAVDAKNKVNAKAEQSTKEEAVSVFKQLVADREAWEVNAYRTSNDALYGILQRCYLIDWGMTNSNDASAKERRAGMAEFAKQKGYNFRDGTPTITKIVKCVFGNVKRSRISTYSLVLRAAKKLRIVHTDIPKFIEDNGGVQQIRMSKSPSFKTTKEKADIAKVQATSAVLGVVKSVQLSQKADVEYVDTQCVLIATQNADGSFAINAVVRSKGALTAALVSCYGANKAVRVDDVAKQEAANDSVMRAEIIKKVVNG